MCFSDFSFRNTFCVSMGKTLWKSQNVSLNGFFQGKHHPAPAVEPHHAPHTSMFQANHIAQAPVLEVMSRGHHKDLRGFTLASFGIRNMSLLVICSFYYHMLFTITPYMFMFCFCINTPVCCMYFASSNINLATYFSLTRSHLS